MPDTPFSLDQLLAGLRAAGEESRLRLLAICAQGEWTVSELCQVMGQSQPRISRHLKLLAEAGLLERFREGSWVFYRRAQSGAGGRVARSLCRLLPEGDELLVQDRQRLAAIRATRREEAARYFSSRAESWDHDADLTIDVARVEAALGRIFSERRCDRLLDVGTGTGRVLQILAGQITTGLGIDSSHDMLRVARANLDRLEARNCQVRHGDMYALPVRDRSVNGVTLHQVLHFADDPFAALSEAARVLQPDGRLVVIDLARHDAEWLRSEKAHRRLGFSDDEMAAWFDELGIEMAPPIVIDGSKFTTCVWIGRLPDDAGRGSRDRHETNVLRILEENAA
ncbi:MAG: metalloregulator ArsR/SmtB family transcription factor [Geminicoccaceae bacterium]|nr:metalloregulator ArsR/SmtB family transcription factor [Geminicoccaceae bacterium]MCB9944000.1 metalloregulator ArsR/SmtB family transcription factor [Geminicoccaceae bacterium]